MTLLPPPQDEMPEPPPGAASSRAHKKRRIKQRVLPPWLQRFETIARHFTAKLLQAAAILVVVGIPLLLIVARVHGLGHDIRHRVEKALSGSFYDVKIHRLLFSISDGLIADDIRLLEHNPSKRLLAHANRVTIFPNLSALSTGAIEIDSFHLHHATIDVPLGNTEEPRLRLDRVEAKIVCPPGQLTLSDASFDLCGIHAHASGNFLNPKTFAPHPVPSNGPGKIAQTIELVQQELLRIHWEGDAPLLEMEFSGDLTHTESLRIDHMTFHSGPCNYGPWNLTAINADLEYANLQLKLQQLSLEDHAGELHVSGNADFQNKQATVNFSGACDVSAISAIAFSKNPMADCTWIDAPHLEGSLGVTWKNGTPAFQSEAHLNAGRFTYRGVAMNTLSAGCIFQDGRFLMRDLLLTGDPGSLQADLMIAPNDYRLRINASIFPQFFAPAATGDFKNFLTLLNFKDPLKVTFDGKATKPDPLIFEGSGSLELGRSSMRGAWIDSLAAVFALKEGVMTFKNVIAQINGEAASGECIYDMKEKTVRFPGVKSALDPVTVMMWIDPHIAESLKDYHFPQPPNLRVTGCIGLKDPQKNDFHIAINAPQGLDYTLIKRNLSFKNVIGTVAIKDQDLLVHVSHASLFGGDVALKADVSIVPGNGRYAADVNLNGIDFKSVTKLYFDYDTSQGNLSGNYHFTTITGDDYAMKGNGALLIKDGSVLAMPIFGPLSLLMNDIYPGLGYQSARRATADFTIQNGVINTKNISIQSAEFSMIGYGDIYYLEDRMNMQMRLNVQGLPGLVLFPVSKLFEYISDGSAKHPVWRPKFVTLPKLPLAK